MMHRVFRPIRGLRSLVLGTLAVWLAAAAPLFGDPRLAEYTAFDGYEKVGMALLDLHEEVEVRKSLGLKEALAPTILHRTERGVIVEVILEEGASVTDPEFDLPGLRVIHRSEQWNRLSVEVEDVAGLRELAALDSVRRVRASFQPSAARGLTTSQAVPAHEVDLGRNRYGLDGSGQRVGILSDSFAVTPGVRQATTTPGPGQSGILRNARNQDSGDLPAEVQILQEILEDDFEIASDEGAGMGELVHDIAPGAAMSFYTAFISESSFADGILALRDAGSTVIVDDVIWLVEPMYQDGPVAQAAQAVVDSGVPFFSAAGNQANRGFKVHYEDNNPQVDEPGVVPPTGNDLMVWPTGSAFLPITLAAGQSIRIVVQWNQPWDSISPGRGSQVDLDAYLYRGPSAQASVLASSTDIQGSTGNPQGDPLEFLFYWNTTSRSKTVYLAVDHVRGRKSFIPQNPQTPLEVRVVFFDTLAEIKGINTDLSTTGGPTIWGHAAAAGALAVGAVPWYGTPNFDTNFGPTNRIDPEPFSSLGGEIPVSFDTAGNYTGSVRFKPEISAVDGVNTTFFGRPLDLNGFAGQPDGFPNFFGTSAAAPNAAAIAALMKEMVPSLSPAEIREILMETAIDVDGRRAAPGLDPVSGHGLIMASAALDEVAERYGISPVPQPTPTPSALNRHNFGFQTTAEGWTFSPVPGFESPTFSTDAGALLIGTRENQNTFGFIQSPEFVVGAWERMGDRPMVGVTGPDSFFRARAQVRSDQLDAAVMPTFRLRMNSGDNERAEVLVVNSGDAGSVAPPNTGKTYDHYFTLPQGQPRFRLFFDVLNTGGLNADQAVFILDSVVVDSLTGGLTDQRHERTWNFRNSTVGWSARTVPDFPAPQMLQDRGLRSGPSVGPDPATNTYFSFWGSPEDDAGAVRIEEDRLYRVTGRVASNATFAERPDTPAFRLRMNDATLNMGAYVNVESTGTGDHLPVGGTPREYSFFFEGRPELHDVPILFSFDYLLVPGAGNDADIILRLEELRVESFAKPF